MLKVRVRVRLRVGDVGFRVVILVGIQARPRSGLRFELDLHCYSG